MHVLPELDPVLNKQRSHVLFYGTSTATNYQPEEASDVVSGMAVQYVSVDVCVKYGDSRSNRSRDIRLPHFVTDKRTTNDDTGVSRS